MFGQILYFTPPENIRKPLEFSGVFRRLKMGTSAYNELRLSAKGGGEFSMNLWTQSEVRTLWSKKDLSEPVLQRLQT